MTSEKESARPEAVEDLKIGTRVALEGRVWQVDAVAALEVALIPAASTVRPQRSDREVPRRVVSIRELVERAEGHGLLWLDRESAKTWNLFDWDDRVRWAARLKVINLLDTGYLTGHPAFEDGPVIPALAGTRLSGRAARRVLKRWLDGPSSEAQEIRHDLNAQHRRESGVGSNLSFEAPSESSIYRWAWNFHMHSIWAVIDGRAEPRATKGERAKRRENSQRLVDEVLAGRTQATSQHSDAWVIRRVVELAEERGIALLGATALRELVSTRHAAAGRTPTQAETQRQDERRTARAVSRPLIPGTGQAWDATLGDVMVCAVPGGNPFRAHVQVAVDLASGVITSLFAVGRYRVANVLLLAFDAFRPMVLLPRSGGGIATRLKT